MKQEIHATQKHTEDRMAKEVIGYTVLHSNLRVKILRGGKKQH